MRREGKIFIFAFLLITTNLWLLAKPAVGSVFANPLYSAGQLLGLLGATLVALNFLLSARSRILERLFGGLDKVYRAHRYVGGAAFVAMIYHPIALSMNYLSSWSLYRRFFFPSGDLAYTLGVLALYCFIALLALTFYRWLSYEAWKATHRLMGIPLFLVLAHAALIPSDVSRFLPLRIWMLGLLGAAAAAYLYLRFIYGKFAHRRRKHVVLQAALRGNVMELQLAPATHEPRMPFLPGQFVFVGVPSLGTREMHPFSISSAPADGYLRLSAKALGDFTRALQTVRAGEEAVVIGPYGLFGERSITSGRAQAWIAGGIGITPFLSLLRYHAALPQGPPITFFYSVRNRAEAVYLDEILRVAHTNPRLAIAPHFSDERGHLTAEMVAGMTGGLAGALVFLCGPRSMVESFKEMLPRFGVRAKDVVSEDFSFLG